MSVTKVEIVIQRALVKPRLVLLYRRQNLQWIDVSAGILEFAYHLRHQGCGGTRLAGSRQTSPAIS